MKFKSLFVLLGLVTFISFTGDLLGLKTGSLFTKVYAQDEGKIFQLTPTLNSPLKVSNIKLDQKSVELGKNFDTNLNWIEKLSFDLENISDKPIVYLEVGLNFPETRTTGILMSYSKSFGLRPNSKLKSKNEPMLLKSGETLAVSLDKEKDKIYKFINERQPVQTIHKIELDIRFIVFEDKTAWSSGSLMQQDPNNPDRYNPIKSDSQY